jgi:hypothetical protein
VGNGRTEQRVGSRHEDGILGSDTEQVKRTKCPAETQHRQPMPDDDISYHRSLSHVFCGPGIGEPGDKPKPVLAARFANCVQGRAHSPLG